MLELRAFSEIVIKPPSTDSLFLSTHDERLTYANFIARVGGTVAILRDLFKRRQTVVFVLCENSAALVITLFALNYLAQVIVLLFPGYAPEELRALYGEYKPSLVIADKRFHPLFSSLGARLLSFEELARAQPAALPEIRHSHDDACFILFTSGARGAAKGVVLTNGNVLANVLGIQSYMRASANERCLITRSLTHASALVGELLLTGLTGGTCVLRWAPKTIRRLFEWCESEAITWMGVSPALLKLVVDYGTVHNCPIHTRRIVVSGSILTPELCLAFLVTFPRTELINAYGLTEASPRVTYLPPDLARVKPGSVGHPIAGCRIRLINKSGTECRPGEVGEIEVAGRNVMRGYFPHGLRRTRGRRAAWLKTGDSGYRDDDGALFVLGRIDTMFVHNGLNIYPEYVAAVFEKCPVVRRAEIVHLEHARFTKTLFAFVELNSEVSAHCAINKIRDHLTENLDTRKHPDEIVIVPSFPLTPSGKIDVKKLLENYLRT